jgi:hypothetical protein
MCDLLSSQLLAAGELSSPRIAANSDDASVGASPDAFAGP